MTILLDFFADWCQPCKQMASVIEAIKKELPEVVIKEINIEEKPEVAQAAGVLSIPTYVIEKDGEETARFVGITAKEKLKAAL